MKLLLKLLASLFLIFNGVGAIYGGWNLIVHPDGSSIQLSPHWLETTPFTSYLIPGIILFIANGVFSFVAFAALIFKSPKFPWLVMAQGVILCGWIVIQILLIQTVYYLHFVLGAVGLALIIIGWMIYRTNSQKSNS